MTNPISVDDEKESNLMDEDEDNIEDLTPSERDLMMNVVASDLSFVPLSSLASDNHALAIILHSSNPIRNSILAPIPNFDPFFPDVEVDDSIRAQLHTTFIKANEQLQN
ncbi:hypothetical protein GOBAR_AA30248 [Gossypium barbadense]|uniref:Uncharacterized protein n=1 Tax=Gossypium barbadense TaxID=3634 RepID=A0A2P5WH81_GOSBA|nr:hypothetical protein GOBAR_AA30248 [Gossypium barbadense]